jgi:hypothetical protein
MHHVMHAPRADELLPGVVTGTIIATGAVATGNLATNAATLPAQTTTTVDFDDVGAYPTPNANHYSPFSTYTHGDGLRAAGSISISGATYKVNVTVTGTIRVHSGNMNVDRVRITINLRNNTTVIDTVYAQDVAFTWNDPVGTGRAVEFPFALSWQGDLSSNTDFKVDTSHMAYDSANSAVYWNDDGTDPSYVRFDYSSTIVAYKR